MRGSMLSAADRQATCFGAMRRPSGVRGARAGRVACLVMNLVYWVGRKGGENRKARMEGGGDLRRTCREGVYVSQVKYTF